MAWSLCLEDAHGPHRGLTKGMLGQTWRRSLSTVRRRREPVRTVARISALLVLTAVYAMQTRAITVKTTASTPVLTGGNIMRTFSMFITASFFLMLGSDCREYEKPKKRWEGIDGGPIMRPECKEPARKCLMSCVDRDASPACTRCCIDQNYVCNTGHKADFESCEGTR